MKFIEEFDDGRVKKVYDDETVEVDGVEYSYSIDWTGLENSDDEGRWSEPYNIEVKDAL